MPTNTRNQPKSNNRSKSSFFFLSFESYSIVIYPTDLYKQKLNFWQIFFLSSSSACVLVFRLPQSNWFGCGPKKCIKSISSGIEHSTQNEQNKKKREKRKKVTHFERRKKHNQVSSRLFNCWLSSSLPCLWCINELVTDAVDCIICIQVHN